LAHLNQPDREGVGAEPPGIIPYPRADQGKAGRDGQHDGQLKGAEMLETIAIILIVLWLLGLVSGYTMGAFIHVLLVLAIILFLVRILTGRRVV
jgi:Family of unknown function (DUF5670)